MWPEPKVVVGAEKIEERPFAPILEILSKPMNLRLISWSAVVAALAVILATRVRKRGS